MSSSTNKKIHVMKILVCGETFVGKTALIQRYVADEYISGLKNTIGVDFFLKQITHVQFEGLQDDDEIDLQIWDISGESRFKEILPMYTHGTAGLAYCFDTNDNLERLTEWEDYLKNLVPPNIPRITFRTKSDLKLVISDQKLKEFQRTSNSAGYFITSVTEGSGFNGAFVSLAKIIYEIYLQKR